MRLTNATCVVDIIRLTFFQEQKSPETPRKPWSVLGPVLQMFWLLTGPKHYLVYTIFLNWD